jgi:hypothetical protein
LPAAGRARSSRPTRRAPSIRHGRMPASPCRPVMNSARKPGGSGTAAAASEAGTEVGRALTRSSRSGTVTVMPPRKSAESSALDDLRLEVGRLREHIGELQSAIDGIREELWLLTGNRRPAEPPVVTPVLKKMAADPCADDWNERLLIIRGDEPRSGPPAAPSPQVGVEPNDSRSPPPGQQELF